jgi:hypothetical protein
MLKQLQKIGSKLGGVKLNAKRRKAYTFETQSANLDNAQIIKNLKASGRDFVGTAKTNKTIMAKLSKTFKVEITRYLKTVKAKTRQARADKAAAKALLNMGESFKAEILKRLNTGRNADGSAVRPLTEEYKRFKSRQFGRTDPVGWASGQLADNLAPGTRNLRLTKR